MKRTVILILTSVVLLSCTSKKTQHFEGQAFGTLYSITYLGEYDKSIPQKVDSVLASISKTFSIFDTNSVIYRFNNGENVDVNEDFIRLLKLSKEISKNTNGAFDCTIQPLVDIWGFGKGGVRHVVAEDSLSEIRKHIGFQLVDIDGVKIIRKDSLVELNFNAIAKGFAVDRVADFIEKSGYSDCIVEIGGEVAVRGTKNGRPWNIGIQTPCANSDDAEESFETFELTNGRAVATSGNYRNYFEENGIRYTHILDPRTGRPERSNLLSVTVLADNCATADAYATAFMVLGFEKSSEIVKKKPELEAWFIISTDHQNWKVEHIK